jgi:hypothetical protein
MKPGKIISYEQTNSAAISVQNELYKIGLWYEHSRLTAVDVIYCSLPQFLIYDAEGFFFHDMPKLNKLVGYKIGHIYIPALVASKYLWQHCESLRGVIRHEYGHAFAHYYPELIIDDPKFTNVFGGHYHNETKIKMEKDAYISDYARDKPAEDFAETFRMYLEHRGILPVRFKNKKLIRKWNYVKNAIKQSYYLK